MGTVDKALSILNLFTIEHAEWTVEEAAMARDLSASTAYQYVRSLVNAGLLVSSKGGRYTVGPAVIELDRLMRRFDPLIYEAQDPLRQMVDGIVGDAIGLLCRIYRLQVMCVDQYARHDPGFAISYERGRPMPLTRGSASKVILAQLPARALRRFYDSDPAEVARAGLGDNWDSFKREVRQLRRSSVLVTTGELDTGLTGISAPVFDADGEVLGSIGLVVPKALGSDGAALEAARGAVSGAAENVTRAIGGR